MQKTKLETITISQDVIERVDGELGGFDEFRRAELGYLALNNIALHGIVLDVFEIAIRQSGEEAARRAIAGSLFGSRVLRYAADESGVALPPLKMVEAADKLQVIERKMSQYEKDEDAFVELESGLAGQEPVIQRLHMFQHTMSRVAATTVLLLHEDVLRS